MQRTPLNKNFKKIAQVGAAHSHMMGGPDGFGQRGNFPNAKSVALNSFAGGGNGAYMDPPAGPSNVAQSAEFVPIRITIQNTATFTLTAPIFSAGEGLTPPFNGSADVNGVVSPSGSGIIVNYVNAGGTSANLIRNAILSGNFYVDRIQFAYGDADQLNEQWSNRTQTYDGQYSTSPYYPDTDQLLGQQVQTKIQTATFKKWVDYTYTLLIPIVGSNTAVLTAFVGSTFSQRQVAQGMPAVTQFQAPNIAVPVLV